MPRSLEEIIATAEETARHLEDNPPDPDAAIDASDLRLIRHAATDRASAEKRLADAVAVARARGRTWAKIGLMVGTTGEAARQRYGSHGTTVHSFPVVSVADVNDAIAESLESVRDALVNVRLPEIPLSFVDQLDAVTGSAFITGAAAHGAAFTRYVEAWNRTLADTLAAVVEDKVT